MAESVDVSNAIADAIATVTTALVATTFTIPEALDAATYGLQTVPPITVAVNRPLQRELNSRLEAGEAMISVETDHVDLSVTQYQNEGSRQDRISTDLVTVTATPNPSAGPGTAWTIGGTATAGNVIGIQTGSLGATYAVLDGDTPTSIAAGLAAACVEAGMSGTAIGATIIADPGAAIRVGASSTWIAAVSRTARHFDAMIWSPDNYLRDFLAGKIETIFVNGAKLAMPDGSAAIVLSKVGTLDSNEAERDNLFLARIRWQIEFVSTRTIIKAPVVAATMNLSTIGSGSTDAADATATAILAAANTTLLAINL